MARIACRLSSSFASMGSPGFSLPNDSAASRSLFLRVADVAAERDVRCRLEDAAQPLHLVVGEGVHRVQQQRPDAGP